jgi:hypothetical protein
MRVSDLLALPHSPAKKNLSAQSREGKQTTGPTSQLSTHTRASLSTTSSSQHLTASTLSSTATTSYLTYSTTATLVLRRQTILDRIAAGTMAVKDCRSFTRFTAAIACKFFTLKLGHRTDQCMRYQVPQLYSALPY